MIIVDAMNVRGSVPDGWWRDKDAALCRLVEAITSHINGHLSAGAAGPRAHDDITCIQTTGGTSWAAAAAILGEIDAATLRLLNGGEAAPLNGQRVCRP